MKKIKYKKRHNNNKYEEEKDSIIETNENYKNNNKNKQQKQYKYLKNIQYKKIIYLSINMIVLFILICESFAIIKLFLSQTKPKKSYQKINIPTNISKNTSTIKKNYTILSKEEALKAGKKYVEICKKGILINKRTFIKSDSPIISVVIPVYNSEKAIKSTIRSIQNQNMLDIEIILVNDNPTDNTTKIIEEMQKEDPRIKIIYNNKSMGTLYSRCVGSLEAKGKYITTIDDDDLFFDENLFDIIYDQTEEEYFDIISFRAFDTQDLKQFVKDYLAENYHKYILHQPELSMFSVKKKDPLFFNNILLWGKLIRAEVYKAAINILGKERYSNYIIWCEDTIIFFLIGNIANSYKFIKQFGIIHFIYKESSSKVISRDILMYGDAFLIDIIFDYSKNEFKRKTIYKLIEIKRLRPYFKLSKMSDRVKEYLKYVIKKIMNCDYIEEKEKNKLLKYFSGYGLFQ